MVRDLVETSIDMIREEKLDESPTAPKRLRKNACSISCFRRRRPLRPALRKPKLRRSASRTMRTREKLRAQLREGKLDQRMVDIEVRERAMPSFEIISNQGVEEMDVNIKDMLSGMFGQQKKKRKMSVADAFEYLIQEEENKLLDMDQVTRVAVERAEQMGIIFIDEIDKVAGANPAMARCIARRRATRHFCRSSKARL